MVTQVKTIKEFTDKSSLLNNCSLSKTIDDFEHLIQSTNTDFGVIAVSESGITKTKLPLIKVFQIIVTNSVQQKPMLVVR